MLASPMTFRFAASVLVLALLSSHSASGQADRALTRAGAQTGRRLALVIGNDSYPASPLRNARNDARSMTTVLRDLGFTVRSIEDATRATLATEVARLADQLAADDIVFFFFSGHGVQLSNENYLIPIDFAGDSPTSTRLTAMAATDIQQALAKARVSLIVLDACRNNPYTGQRTGGGGLAAMEGRGSLIAFAAGAGQTASDNPQAQNGLFTQELLNALRQENLTTHDIFSRVRQSVFDASGGRQFPAVYDNLLGDLVLRPGAGNAARPSTPSVSESDLQLRAEIALWESVSAARGTASERQLLVEYKRLYANGRFAGVADVRLAELTTPVAGPAPNNSVSPTSPTTASAGSPRSPYLGRTATTRSTTAAAWQQHHVVLGQNGDDYVPYSIVLSPTTLLTNKAVALYVRAVDSRVAGQRSSYAWDSVYFRTVDRIQGIWQGALQLAPGAYRISMAFMPVDGIPRDRKAQQPFIDALKAAVDAVTTGGPISGPIVVLEQSLELPSLRSDRLMASSLVLASSVTQVPTSAFDPQEQPYRFGAMQIVPLAERPLLARNRELNVIFWIYNARAAASGKPDVTIDYSFYQLQPSGPKYFNKTAPQALNASTLPPEFSVAAGHQLPGSLVVPLASFPVGDYELQVRIRDNAANDEILHRAEFMVR